MIIEGIITTEDSDGKMHVAPIGPHVDEGLNVWELKPFQTSTTFSNLYRTGRGVFHVVDDALLMARAVLGLCNDQAIEQFAQFDPTLGWVLDDACRCFALKVQHWDVSQPRAIAQCEVKHQFERRPFWGWNRARHSILELAILASRMHLLDRDEIDREVARHKIIIDKTAGDRERLAWDLLQKRLSQ